MTFGKWGSAELHERYAVPVDSRHRRRCSCGCRQRETHRGMANGVALMSGCQLYVRRWVRDGKAITSTGHRS